MVCSRRLYKGNDYEICLPLTDTGVTLVRFYTGKDVYVEKEPEISGDSMCFSLTKEDLEPLTDGVIRYEVVTEYETTDTNSPYVLKTPENYDAKSLDEIIEEAYQSGYTDGYESGYTDGQETCHDYSKDYFTIETLEDGEFYVRKTIKYSINDGDWTQINNAAIPVNAGDKIRFQGNKYSDTGLMFSGNTIQFNVSGNIMSLHYGTDFEEETTCFDCIWLFYGSTGLIDASNLVLPATTLVGYCYQGMFGGCTNLTSAPELPATTLASYCYSGMFQGCRSLTQAPALPAETLTDWCYQGMFTDCTSLTAAPELPATTLADNCYNSMFAACTGLTSAPELPATTLASNCYIQMFAGCNRLNYIKCLATNISASNCTSYWVPGVAASGTFVKAAGVDWPTGINGIPEGWTVISQ